MDKMASPKAVEISAAELEIKRRGRRRLIGAVTIGLLAIVFLPMIFDSEPERNRSATKSGSQEISIQIPPKDGLPPLPAPSTASSALAPTAPKAAAIAPPLAAAAAPAAAPPVASVMPVEQKPATAFLKPEPAPKVAAKVEPIKPERKPEPIAVPSTPAIAASAAPTDNKQGFVVQVGAFKDAENTKQIVAQAKTAKLPVYTDTVATTNGTVTRVRVGPFSTKQKADAALAQLKLSGSDGKIVPLQ
jgi:DedD protein